ncbi:MAG: hypothetical protein JWR69_184, partial [Pedosphaera sp.]|nr:hypothetical protein [Pedosphaera sp.]
MAPDRHLIVIEVLLPNRVAGNRLAGVHPARLGDDEPLFRMLYPMPKDFNGLIAVARLGVLVFATAWLPRPSAIAQPAATAASTPAGSATNGVNPRTFEVSRYLIAGNSVLRPEVFGGIFTNATGPAVSLERIRKALADLQLAYRERGFATVAVSLPQQQLTNATVKVTVTEGTLADIRVRGHRFFSSENVLRALPSLHTNTLLNSHIFQRELDLANANRDRQIYPTIEPGPEPGTSALELRVKDRLPFHGRFDLDNYSTPGTPDLRMNLAAQYNNLWQREHQLGLSYGFTPEELKAPGLTPNYFFNQPLISYYGAYYRMPFGGAPSVQEQINSSLNFGYNEATHQFRLPPAGVRPDLTIYASASSSDTGVNFGERQTVAHTPLLTIESQDTGRDFSVNEDLGGRLSVPLTVSDNARFSFSGGADFKRYALSSFNT